MPTPKAARRLWRHSKGHLSVRRVYYSVELAIFAAFYVIVFSGGRLRYLDSFGRRADWVFSLLLSATLILLHWLARKHLLPRIERYYEPIPYDERKIFFDLGQGAQQVSTIDQLYQQLAEQIRDALEANNASIFVRDEATGNFNLRVLSTKGRPGETSASLKQLKLSPRAFVVRRLNNLSAPLVIEQREIETWSQALNSVLPSMREERAGEHDTLRTIKARLLVQIRQKHELVGIL